MQNPMAIPGTKSGRYYFECYPHPALLGVFDLDHIVKYKVARKSADGWRSMIELILSLAHSEFPVNNIGEFVKGDLPQNKKNEDKLDAIVCAYTAAYWWKFGTERSTMIGDLTSGYIVTPHSHRTYARFKEVFVGRMNRQGRGDGSHSPIALETNGSPVEALDGWSSTVELSATDTTNIWRTSQGAAINAWMDPQRMTGWRLCVRFLEEDSQPEILFVPFENQGSEQCGMKASLPNRDLWNFMVADATRLNPLGFQVSYRYEEIG